ncbi:MAG: BamA/TamA family outer membrane protein [Acidobacteriota bacterium]
MKKLILTGLLAFATFPPVASAQDAGTEADAASPNVNARYTVERVSVHRAGWSFRQVQKPLQNEIDNVVGQNLDQSLLESLATRIKEDLNVPAVHVRVSKGRMPERVVVTFEAGEKEQGFDLDVERFLYHSKQGWTGEGGASVRFNGNKLSFGMVSDGDRLMERYAGIQAGFERHNVGTDRLGLRFRFLSYHQQWNRTTLEAALPGELYRTRQHFVPEATLRLAEPLELSFGVDFARYQTFLPNPVALGPRARTESSNAAVSTLRYRQRWGLAGDPYEQEFSASYGLRAATGVLESDVIFARHLAEAEYKVKHGHQEVKVSFVGGKISGNAPLFERFALGNAETLRGWNKFDVNPLGSTRVAHGSIDYSYHAFLIFYDTGSAWTVYKDPEQKQSLGVGLRSDSEGFTFAVAFPIKTGHANPVVYVGMNF